MKICYRLWVDEAGHRHWLADVRGRDGQIDHQALPSGYAIQFRPDTFPVGTVLTADIPEGPPEEVVERFRELLIQKASNAPGTDPEMLSRLVDNAVRTLAQGQAQVASALVEQLLKMGLAVEITHRVESDG